ncbi:unnamed protein product [Rotaria sordida]|uniref:J domain-containing protein n=1 Tax=Rotaria sordida TaxID=392033 RepID=A0A815P9U9_9BILA|nr:unnamed protein product [Rotaria sordida]CAF1446084.1 unnamed protein product [Rotaria sordida]
MTIGFCRLCLLHLGITKRYITNISRASADRFIRQCHSILEVDLLCRDEAIIRKAYLEKVKQYHPNSSFQDNKADHVKFNQVQQTYETLLEALKSNDSLGYSSTFSMDDIYIKFDIRHAASQYQTHLEYGETFIHHLVENLIQESMSRGDFNNIRPSGKSLYEHNPHYVDFTTYKINEMLIDNGYMPEWVLLEKTISPNSLFDRDILTSLFPGNQSPTLTDISSSVDKWTDSAGELLVQLDNLSMLGQICDNVSRLPPKPSSINRSINEIKS